MSRETISLPNKLNSEVVKETAINVISEDTRIEGKLTFNQISRVHGILIGEVIAEEGSMLILGETSIVEGNINADTLLIDGYVKGDISARTKVIVSRTGRVIGNIQTGNLELEFGAYFEGRCMMGNSTSNANS